MANGKKSGSVTRADADAAADRIAARYAGRDASRLERLLNEKTAQPAADTLRQAIEETELTRYELAHRAGVAQSMLSRFVTGERGVSLETFEKLCAALDLEVTLTPKRKPRRAPRAE